MTIIVAILTFACILGFNGAPLWAWTLLLAAALAGASCPSLWAWIVFAGVALILNVAPIRRVVLSTGVLALMKKLKLIPEISETERTALSAGDVWIEGELFSGKPDFRKVLGATYPELTPEEQAFMDGPVDELCRMSDDWDIWERRDLSPESWAFIKKEKFLGMIIPKEYGGLGFSALAHSEVLSKLTSRSTALCITVMVPNSLGPAELLMHYGTEAQKRHYLPLLARGEEIPCFALTEPNAGSDAGSLQATGVVFRGEDGKLYLRLNWNKRWITLAAISTVLGLAFRMRDPDNLLGKGKGADLGITCALIPTRTPGVVADRRHDPLGVPFYNCPTQGHDVVVPVEAIIGGLENAGKGWKMLMESLAAGRGISLPAQATGGAKFVTRVASAHASVRKQFGVAIGKFEGVAEPLARMGGWTYLMEAGRRYTLGAIDQGAKPPVVTAIAKYNYTELSRKIVNDGMDILGGQAISRGRHNLLAHAYFTVPVGITVEGANILTRTLIIFGQGALRAHPYAFKEVDAVERNDLVGFDFAFWGHIGHVIRNGFRMVLLSLSRGRFATSPVVGPAAQYWRKLAWSSATFAFMADLAMGSLGGKLKFREKITGRFADVLSWMYLASATLKRFEAEGRRQEDLPFLKWSLDYAFQEISKAFDGLFSNLEVPLLSWLFRGPVLWYSRMNPISRPPSDELGGEVATLCMRPGLQRERLFGGIFESKNPEDQAYRLEEAFRLSVLSEEASGKVRKALKNKSLVKKPAAELYRDALAQGVLTQSEFDSIEKAEIARNQVIQVDDFGLKEYTGQKS